MPAQERLGLDEVQRLPPGADVPGKQHQECPICPRHSGPRDAALLHQQLLAQQRILDEELRPVPQEVTSGPLCCSVILGASAAR